MHTPSPRSGARERVRLESRHDLNRAAAVLMDDPQVLSCTFDVPNLMVEVALAGRTGGRAASAWRRRLDRALRPAR